jgi:hypothetical protein
MRIIRASEIGAFVYCQRAWWYQLHGEPSENQAELASGREIHEQHGRNTLVAGCLRLVGYALLLLALIVFVYSLTIKFF